MRNAGIVRDQSELHEPAVWIRTGKKISVAAHVAVVFRQSIRDFKKTDK
jgi:hypothetical protein